MIAIIRKSENRGFILVFTALCILGLIGALGLVVDIGRIYIAKSELQVFTDSAAVAATMELDGTSTGIQRATAQVAADSNTWNLATTAFSGATIQFSQNPTGPWDSNPANPKGYLYAQVQAQEPQPIYFMPSFQAAHSSMGFLILSSTFNVNANSSSGQQSITGFNDGLFPFSPFAHDPTTGPHYGLIPGHYYTLRWASNPKLGQNVCPDDNTQAMIDLQDAGGGSERGYIQDTSANIIRQTIENDYQSVYVQVGGTVTMTGGSKQAELDALENRVAQDTDSTSATYEDYIAGGLGNGRRLVGAPINTGSPDYTVVQIGAFFLLPASSYSSGGNNAWCAEYEGAWVKAAKNKGAADSGAYVTRLIQ